MTRKQWRERELKRQEAKEDAERLPHAVTWGDTYSDRQAFNLGNGARWQQPAGSEEP